MSDLTQTPPVSAILQFFDYEKLPPPLREVSETFHHLAHHLADTLRPGPELTVALRKLLESKDAAVRAALPPK
ncbi:MAG TPA: hypothetical protein VFV67_34080 [Actinophytocola sp.]|uniref:hypothetical protein n=1 Tax=Actinophytocola sp. TaxID=1872138 RepID=UPI002DB7DC78|nr:hypothetical protein [Actinophytocola sp.]HEU5475697.1 hypothetical protein [Actinophytocola sp.]